MAWRHALSCTVTPLVTNHLAGAIFVALTLVSIDQRVATVAADVPFTHHQARPHSSHRRPHFDIDSPAGPSFVSHPTIPKVFSINQRTKLYSTAKTKHLGFLPKPQFSQPQKNSSQVSKQTVLYLGGAEPLVLDLLSRLPLDGTREKIRINPSLASISSTLSMSDKSGPVSDLEENVAGALHTNHGGRETNTNKHTTFDPKVKSVELLGNLARRPVHPSHGPRPDANRFYRSDIPAVFSLKERLKRDASGTNDTSETLPTLNATWLSTDPVLNSNDSLQVDKSNSGTSESDLDPDLGKTSRPGVNVSMLPPLKENSIVNRTSEEARKPRTDLLVDVKSVVDDTSDNSTGDNPGGKGDNFTEVSTGKKPTKDLEPVYNSSGLFKHDKTNLGGDHRDMENSSPLFTNDTDNQTKSAELPRALSTISTNAKSRTTTTTNNNNNKSNSTGAASLDESLTTTPTPSSTFRDVSQSHEIDTQGGKLGHGPDITSSSLRVTKSNDVTRQDYMTNTTMSNRIAETTSPSSSPRRPTEAHVGAVLSSLVSNDGSQPNTSSISSSSSPDTSGLTSGTDNIRFSSISTAEPELTTESDGLPGGVPSLGVGNDSDIELDGDSSEEPITKPESEPTSEPKPEPSGESETEPTGEPDVEPTGEPDTEPTGEPDTEPTTEPEGEPIDREEDALFPLPEPGPQWDEAIQKWGIAWDVHIYGAGGAFAAVGLYILLSLVRLWRIPRLLSRGYFLSLNLLMLGLCGTRAVYLLYDSYNSRGTFPTSVDYFLYSIAFPCLSAAFSVLLYALLKATNMQLVSPSVQRLPVLLFIIIVHFGLSLASDLLVGHFAGARIVLFVCQMYYVLWGLFLFAGYAYIFRRLYSHAVKRQKNVIYSSTSSSTFPGGSNGSLTSGKVRSRYTLSTAVKVTFFTALCGLVTVGLELYAVAGVYNTFTWDRPEPWPWYVYHSVLRALELAMCVTMSYVASQPFRYLRSERSCCSCGVVCLPCSEILCCCSSRSYDLEHHRQHVTSAGSCSYSDLDLAPTKLHSTRLRSPGDRDQLQNYSSPGSRKRPVVISPPGPPQPSLLIIEDGYVRFQTEHDINRMVDSSSGVRPDIHSDNTLPLRDGWFNSGYARHGDEGRADNNKLDTTSGLPWEEENKSRKSSLAGSEFFRVPSSVSLAGSIENELEKAFVTFRSDTSRREEDPEKFTPVEDRLLDITAVSELPNMKETDLISVDSLTEPDCDLDLQQEPFLSLATTQNRESPHGSPHLDKRGSPLYPGPSSLSPRRPFTLLRRAKSSEMGEPDQAWTQLLRRSLSDHATTARRSPLKSESNSVRYTHLLDMDSTDSKLSDAGQSDLDDVFNRLRPPELCAGTGDATTRSLLKSSSDNNDNIDV